MRGFNMATEPNLEKFLLYSGLFKNFERDTSNPNVKEKVTNTNIVNRIGRPEDSVIQNHLDLSTSMVRDMLGLLSEEILPNDQRVFNAIYLLAQYFIENRSSQEETTSVDLSGIKQSRQSYYRAQIFKPVLNQVLNMIRKFRKHERFILKASFDEAISENEKAIKERKEVAEAAAEAAKKAAEDSA